MSERVAINGRNVRISRQYGLLYFIGENENIYSTPMQRRSRMKGNKQKHTLVLKTGLVRNNQKYVYFIDSEGYLACTERRRK